MPHTGYIMEWDEEAHRLYLKTDRCIIKALEKNADFDPYVGINLYSYLFDLSYKEIEVNPFLYPKCSSEMRVIAVIEDSDVIKKILKHLGVWDIKQKPSPVANAPPIDVFPVYDEQPGSGTDDYIVDPQYPAEAYF